MASQIALTFSSIASRLREAALRGRGSPARVAAAVLAGSWAYAAQAGASWSVLAAAAGYARLGWAVSLAAAALLVFHVSQGSPAPRLAVDAAGVVVGGVAQALASEPRRGGGSSITALLGSVLVASLPVAGVLAAIALYNALVASIDSLPLTFREVLTPLESTFAGRLLGAAAAVGLGSYISLRIASLAAASMLNSRAAAALARAEAEVEVELMASGRDYPTRVLMEVFYGLSALLLAPTARVLVDGAASLAGLADTRYYQTLAPLAYYMLVWILIRVFTPLSLFRPEARPSPPRPIIAAIALAVPAVFAAAWMALMPGGASTVAAALGLGDGDAVEVDLNTVDREYVEFVESLVSVLEFAIRFFWAG